MARMPHYNRDTKRLEWVDADESSPEYQSWKSKLRAGGRKGAAKSKARAASSTSDTLDDETPSSGERPEPTGPKRAPGGANTRPQSMLAPVLPRIAQSLAIGIMAGTRNLTGGRAPMTQQEAVAVAIPAVRIADRTAAKYIKKTGKVTPNQEDAALIILTVVVWLVGWLVSSLQNKPRQGQQGQPGSQAQPTPPPESADLFAGSEPVAPPSPAAPGRGAQRPAPSPAPETGATGEPAIFDERFDDSELFAGSEPIAPGADIAQPTPVRTRVTPEQAAANERLWQIVSPPDRGETLAG